MMTRQDTVSAAPPPIVCAEGLSKVFRDFWRRPKVRAVAGIDFEVRSGEVFGLLGPNGSGKSTTLKMMLGLLDPTAGRLRVFDLPPRHVRSKARIGYLPEESYLHPFLTPHETLDFYGRLFDLGRAERARRRDQLLEMVGLAHVRHRPVGEFSKGMARRVGLAQALINDPDLVILDEPTSGLDPVGCRQVKDLIGALARRGKTVVLSSHLLADVEDVCRRIAIMYNGAIVVQGAVRDLLERREQVRVTLTGLTPETQARILTLLRGELGLDPPVDHPARTLEQFFIEAIARARVDAAGGGPDAPPSTGAVPADTVADYLAGPRA